MTTKENRFKDHILIETHLKEGEYNLDIWDFKLPTSDYTNRIKFINTCNVMTVTGDFGNWVFCREFHPSKGGKISRGYADEKLQYASEQTSSAFDSDYTLELIEEFEKEYLEDVEEQDEDVLSWIEDLKSSVYDKIEYENIAYREQPTDFDYELIPYGKKRHIWLETIYDAFDEICKSYGELK